MAYKPLDCFTEIAFQKSLQENGLIVGREGLVRLNGLSLRSERVD